MHTTAAALCLLLLGTSASAATPEQQVAAVSGLISRLIPQFASSFRPEIWNASQCTGETGLCFGYRSGADGSIVVSGTTGVEASMALQHYLKYGANCSVSWPGTGGDQLYKLTSLSTLPPVSTPVVVNRAHKMHYYANVCTFSYSFVWYQLDDWQREIDWMALNGVNLPLAYTGQEKIYQKTYNDLGITDEELSGFWAGPAFMAWARGQGLMAWGGPLPQQWIDGQWNLSRQILPMMRAFGMKPVLPAFQGNVPVAMLTKYPDANISRIGSCPTPQSSKYGCAPWMDALDPLFNKTQDTFLTHLITDFGTDHVYAADGTFSLTSAPWYSSQAKNPVITRNGNRAAKTALSTMASDSPPFAPPPDVDPSAYVHSQAAFASMLRTDPDASWVFQTWSWVYGATDAYMRGWVTAVPKGRLLLLDLMAESDPIWKVTDSYYGAPFIWCMLHNFGGNSGMWGDLMSLSVGPTGCLANESNSIAGTGLTMEGTNTNPVVYEFMNEMAYRQLPVSNMDGWLSLYAERRYPGSDAAASANAAAAWVTFGTTAYNYPQYGMMASKDTVQAIPYGTPWDVLAGSHWYNETTFLTGWQKLLAANQPSVGSWTYAHDLATVTAQALAKYSTTVFNNLNNSIAQNNTAGIDTYGQEMVKLIQDIDSVSATVPSLLMGAWVKSAAAWSFGNQSIEDLMIFNAKRQVSFWSYATPQDSSPNAPMNQPPYLMDYAAKHWAGLLGTYHAPRWALYVDWIKKQLASHEAGFTPDKNDWDTTLVNWYNEWQTTNQNFPVTPTGDTWTISSALYAAYSTKIMQ